VTVENAPVANPLSNFPTKKKAGVTATNSQVIPARINAKAMAMVIFLPSLSAKKLDPNEPRIDLYVRKKRQSVDAHSSEHQIDAGLTDVAWGTPLNAESQLAGRIHAPS
jgi:hypothetical protein